MGKTRIPWVRGRDGKLGEVVNPVVGCTPVSEGCAHCWANRLHTQRHEALLRGSQMPEQYRKPFGTVQLFPDRIAGPMKRRKPTAFFWCSTSDLFHEDVPFEFIDHCFIAMASTQRHLHYVLTKRPWRMLDWLRSVGGDPPRGIVTSHWPLPNVLLGITAENQIRYNERLPYLMQCPAVYRFVSIEPQLGPVDLHLDGPCPREWGHGYKPISDFLHWVIAGSESAPGNKPGRPFELDWARSLVEQGFKAQVPLWIKQAEIGGKLVHRPRIDGVEWHEHPVCDEVGE